MPRAFLFDLDGTLVDLDVDIEPVRRELAAMFGPLGYSAGFSPILACIDEAAKKVSTTHAERAAHRRAARALIDRAEVVAAASARACAGAADALAASDALPRGIVTDNGRACVMTALRAAGLARWGWPPERVVTRDDVDRPKPDSAGVLSATAQLLPYGGELWFVGNSTHDVAAGLGARAALVGTQIVIVGVGGDELTNAGADHVIGELGQLPGLL